MHHHHFAKYSEWKSFDLVVSLSSFLPPLDFPSSPLSSSRAFKSHGINSPDITSQINKAPFQSLGMILLNRLPEWDDILECLVLKFQGNRVRFPSARNILLFEEHEINRKKKYKKECEFPSLSLPPHPHPTAVSLTPPLHCTPPVWVSLLFFSSVTADDAIFQFGKSLPEEYVLDFRYPLSPLQSFAIALSTYSYATTHGGQPSSAPGSGSGSGRSHQAQNPKP
jgi:hypothetical protein